MGERMPFQQERMPFRAWEYRTETAPAGYDVDLAGYPVAAVDGDIGHVDEATNELLGSSYLVVDTGPWIFGRKVLLPAGVVERIDTVEKKVYVDRTKDQIKNSPEYDELVDDAQYRDRLGGYYAETYNGPDTRI
jgi:PRC-barrel domain